MKIPSSKSEIRRCKMRQKEKRCYVAWGKWSTTRPHRIHPNCHRRGTIGHYGSDRETLWWHCTVPILLGRCMKRGTEHPNCRSRNRSRLGHSGTAHLRRRRRTCSSGPHRLPVKERRLGRCTSTKSSWYFECARRSHIMCPVGTGSTNWTCPDYPRIHSVFPKVDIWSKPFRNTRLCRRSEWGTLPHRTKINQSHFDRATPPIWALYAMCSEPMLETRHTSCLHPLPSGLREIATALGQCMTCNTYFDWYPLRRSCRRPWK